jgi:hypothetical protein
VRVDSGIELTSAAAAAEVRLMPMDDYLPMVVSEFKRLKSVADGALAQVSVEQLFHVGGAEDNSLAVIMKHLSGNMVSRWRDFLTSDGEKPARRRDDEFIITAADTRDALFARWESGWGEMFAALAPLRAADLARTVTIRGEAMSVLHAIQRQLTHYAYHIGQIVFLAKHLVGPTWKTLSIPRGKSEEFNRAPVPYVEKNARA